jgi:glucose-6-phosphate 1-dehydrogenase
MDFDYQTDFPSGTPEAYERLLMDCMAGEGTLFTRADEVEEAWEIVDPVRIAWAEREPAPYGLGSWGPEAADELLARDGRAWRNPA